MNILAFLFSLAIFVAGFFVMGAAFNATENQAIIFASGILCTALGFGIPAHVLKRFDG